MRFVGSVECRARVAVRHPWLKRFITWTLYNTKTITSAAENNE